MNWRDKHLTRTFEFGVSLFAGKYLQIIIPAERKEHVGLIKSLWEEDEPVDGFRKVKVETGVRVQREEYLPVISFYRVVEKKAKLRMTLRVQHGQAAYLLGDLWERRGRRSGTRYPFRVWCPKSDIKPGAKVSYDGPYKSVPIGYAFQIGLSRKREWDAKFMNAVVPF